MLLPHPDGPAIETEGLVKLFGATRAVDGVDLSAWALRTIARVCAGFDVDGMRADIVIAAAGVPGIITGDMVKPGAAVTSGQPLFTLLADDDKRFDRALDALEGAWELAAPGTALEPRPLVIDRIAQEAPHA